jgi:hypothetical protein
MRGVASGGEALLTTLTGGPPPTTYDDVTATDTTKTYYYKVVAVNGVGESCANNEVAAPYVGDSCSGITIHQNDPTHPEVPAGANTPASLLIDKIVVGEPIGTSNLMFKMKVNSLATIPPNSRWRMVWDSFASPGQQYYVGMTTGATGAPTFEYGTIATAVVGLVVGVPTETMVGTPDPASNFQADGTITIYVSKSAVGNPQPGDLLGAVNGRTFNTGDTPPETLERSTALIDHTFVKAQTDNSYPAATYTVAGPSSCLLPVRAVSRKTHGSISPPFDIDLPLSGNVGIECRLGGTPTGNHTIVVTFATPISAVASATCAGNPATTSISSNQVTVNCTGVPNAQTIAINLVGVSDGTNTGNASIPMGVLLGDVNASGRVDSGDVFQVRQNTGQGATLSNFRNDVNTSGRIDSGDVFAVRQQTGTGLP